MENKQFKFKNSNIRGRVTPIALVLSFPLGNLLTWVRISGLQTLQKKTVSVLNIGRQSEEFGNTAHG